MATSHKVTAETEVNACQETVNHVALQIVTPLGYDHSISRKQAHSMLGDELEQHRHRKPKPTRYIDGLTHSLTGPFDIS